MFIVSLKKVNGFFVVIEITAAHQRNSVLNTPLTFKLKTMQRYTSRKFRGVFKVSSQKIPLFNRF